jgi:hypothetical protein
VESRRGENEARFRDLNEKLEQRALRTPSSDLTFDIVCECDEEDCTETLTVGYLAYEAVRHDATMFIVARGHADPELEKVVSRGGGYEIVEKYGEAALTALVTYPRS